MAAASGRTFPSVNPEDVVNIVTGFRETTGGWGAEGLPTAGRSALCTGGGEPIVTS